MVPVKPTQWPGDRAKRISVNSFGIGGSNAHVSITSPICIRLDTHQLQIILDAPAEHVRENKRNNNVLNKNLPCQLGFLSANTQESLRQYTSSIQGYASLHPGSVPDLVYTLALHREQLIQRSFIIFDKNGGIMDTSSPVKAPTRAPEIVMVFSGQGAQWPTMGKELIHSDQAFGGAIREMDGILKSLTHPPTWSLAGRFSFITDCELDKPLTHSQRSSTSRTMQTSIRLNFLSLSVQPCNWPWFAVSSIVASDSRQSWDTPAVNWRPHMPAVLFPWPRHSLVPITVGL